MEEGRIQPHRTTPFIPSSSTSSVAVGRSPALGAMIGGSTNSSTHRCLLHTIQFHPRRRIAFIERLPGSVLIHSLGPYLTGDEMLRLGFSSGRIMNSLHYDFSSAPYQYQPPPSNDIWCLKVIQRRYPRERTYCRYFSTKREAEEAEIDEQRDFIDEYRPRVRLTCPCPGNEGPDNEDADARLERLDAKFDYYSGQWGSYDAGAFESEIFKVEVETKQEDKGTSSESEAESEKSDQDWGSQPDDEDADDHDDEEEEEEEDEVETPGPTVPTDVNPVVNEVDQANTTLDVIDPSNPLSGVELVNKSDDTSDSRKKSASHLSPSVARGSSSANSLSVLPAVLLLQLSEDFLHDIETIQLGRASSYMVESLKSYNIKRSFRPSAAIQFDHLRQTQKMRLGQVRFVLVPDDHSDPSSNEKDPHYLCEATNTLNNSGFPYLPIVLLQLIYQCLPLGEFLYLSRTSRLFQQIGCTAAAWKSYDVKRKLMNPHVSGILIQANEYPLKHQFGARVIQLNSSHTSHLLHHSLIRSNAHVHWDVCHCPEWIQEGEKWIMDRKRQYDTDAEVRVLTANLPCLTSLVIIANSLTNVQLEHIFKACSQKEKLKSLVLTNEHGQIQSDPILTHAAFINLMEISSIERLSINSIYYSDGQLSLLNQLPRLSSLSLIELPWCRYARIFNRMDLLTIGSCPSLTELMMSSDQLDPSSWIQFLQQPFLQHKLQSVIMSGMHRSSEFSEENWLAAFKGYNHLRQLKVYKIRCSSFHETLLSTLSTSSPNCDTPSATFLPMLVSLSYHYSASGYLPSSDQFRLFLQTQSRLNLSISIQSHVDTDFESIAHLPKLDPQFSIQLLRPLHNSPAIHRPGLFQGSQSLYPLISVGWLSTDDGEVVRTVRHDRLDFHDNEDEELGCYDNEDFVTDSEFDDNDD